MSRDVESSFGVWVRDLEQEPFRCFLADTGQQGIRRIVSIPLELVKADEEEFTNGLETARQDPSEHVVSPESWRSDETSLCVVFPHVEFDALLRWWPSEGADRDPVAVFLQIARGIQRLSQAGLTVLGSDVLRQVVVTDDSEFVIKDAGLYVPLRNQMGEGQERSPFLAPEFGLQDSGARLDVYSLGRLLLYLLQSDNSTVVEYDSARGQWIDAHNRGTINLLDRVHPEIHPCLQKSLATDPADRYEDLDQFLSEVDSISQRLDLRAIGHDEEADDDGRREERTRRILGGLFTLLTLLTPMALAYVAAMVMHDQGTSPAFDEADLSAAYLASRPGEDGQWWIDDPEVYRLLPPVRERLMEVDAEQRSGLVNEWLAGGKLPDDKLLQDASYGYERHIKLLQPAEGLMGLSAKRLEWLLSKTPADGRATTTHLRAVILHKLAVAAVDLSSEEKASSRQQAINEYKKALQDYPWYQPGLKALCHSDYARLLASDTRHKAEEQYDLALNLIGTAYLSAAKRHAGLKEMNTLTALQREHFGPFVVQVLCQQAALHRRAGEWDKAKEKLRAARNVLELDIEEIEHEGKKDFQITGVKDKETNQLKAFVLERSAWFLMDRWRVDQARACFIKAREIRDGEGEGDAKTSVFGYHNWHGEAMAARYGGNNEQARDDYEVMIPKLERDKEEAKKAKDATRKSRLEARLLESYQRHGDSYLFGSTEDAENKPSDGNLKKALSNYKKALVELERQHLLRDPNPTTFAKLKIRSALAMALRGELDDARGELREADDMVSKKNSHDGGAPRPPTPPSFTPPKPAAKPNVEEHYSNQRLHFLRNLVDAFIDFKVGKKQPEDLVASIRREFVRLNKGQKVSRDELDAVLLIARQLPLCELHADLNEQLADFPQETQLEDYLAPTRQYVARARETAQKESQ